MAETLGTAELILTADTTRLQAGLQAGRQNVERYNRETTASFERAGRAQLNTLDGINARLNQLRSQRGGAAIGSAQFRSINAEIAQIERLQQQAERGRGGPGLLDGLLGAVSVGAVVAGLKSAVDAASELEGITRRLSNTLGAQGAQGALGFTRGLADELGLSFKTLAGGFASFTAAASAANVPLEQQKALFSAVARSGQALGLSNDAINGSLLALQQVAAKGTVQMEELRGQLGERLPTAFAATARGLGISTKELIKLVESGQLSSDRFFPALTKGLNELNTGATGVPTAAQNFEKLANSWDKLQTAFGQSLLPTVISGVKQLNDVLEGVLVDAKAYDFTKTFNLPVTDARALVGYLNSIQAQFGLTDQQAKNVLSDALAQVGGSKNIFGQLVLSGEQLADVMGKARDRAKEFTAASRASQEAQAAEIAAAQRETQRLEQIEKARVESAKRLSTAKQDELRDLVRTRGLQGEALSFAQDQLAIERARRELALAQADMAGIEASPMAPAAAAKAAAGALAEAGANLGLAIEQAAQRAQDRLREASERIRQAAETLRGAREGFAGAVGQQFAIATNQQRQRAREILEQQVRAAERQGAFDPSRVAARFGVPQTAGGLDLSQLTFRQLERLAQQTGTLANAEATLQGAVTENTKALQALAARRWEVQVNVRNNASGATTVDYQNVLR